MVVDSETGFDAYAIITEITRMKPATADRLSAIEHAVKQPLLNALTGIRRTSPATYTRMYAGKPALSVMLGVIEDGRAFVYLRGFVASQSIVDPIEITVEAINCPGANCAENVAFPRIGQADMMNNFISKKHPRLKSLPPEDAVRFLVTSEIVTHPGVGGPIDILKLSQQETRWIQLKPECQKTQDGIADKPKPTSKTKKPRL